MNLRWIERDGKQVLQINPALPPHGLHNADNWQDVPIKNEEHVENKAREFYIIRGSAYLVKTSEDQIHVREVLPGEIVVTREMLAEAWLNAELNPNAPYFSNFINTLGLKS